MPWTPPGIAGSASAASGRGCRAVGYFVDFTSDPIDTIVGQAGGGMSRVSFDSGGSEATDRHQDRPALSSHPRPTGCSHFFARQGACLAFANLEAAAFTTGTTLAVDAGWLAG